MHRALDLIPDITKPSEHQYMYPISQGHQEGPQTKNKPVQSLGYASVEKLMPCMFKGLGLIPGTEERKHMPHPHPHRYL